MRVGLGLAALAAGLSVASAGWAFGTVKGVLGQNVEHERITRAALGPMGFEPRSLDEIAGTARVKAVPGTWGAVGAPDNPARGLMGQHSAHCDGGDAREVAGYPQSARDARTILEECRTWIFDRLDEAVNDAGPLVVQDDKGAWVPAALQFPGPGPVASCWYNGAKGRAKCNVLEQLGLAFHASQDFYSHSNWVDVPAADSLSPINPPGLGANTPAPWLDPFARPKDFPRGLITGCFESVPEAFHCNYGPGWPRVKHEFLNKDGPQKVRSSVNGNFERAFIVAKEDTVLKWRYFEARVLQTYGPDKGPAIVCAVKRDDPSNPRPCLPTPPYTPQVPPVPKLPTGAKFP